MILASMASCLKSILLSGASACRGVLEGPAADPAQRRIERERGERTVILQVKSNRFMRRLDISISLSLW